MKTINDECELYKIIKAANNLHIPITQLVQFYLGAYQAY